MPPKNLKRGGQSKETMVPKRFKRRRTTNPRYATGLMMMMEATRYRDKRRTRQSPNLQNNLKSAREAPDLIEQKLHKEVALGRVAGPFESIPFPTFRVSPVGLVPKKDGDV